MIALVFLDSETMTRRTDFKTKRWQKVVLTWSFSLFENQIKWYLRDDQLFYHFAPVCIWVLCRRKIQTKAFYCFSIFETKLLCKSMFSQNYFGSLICLSKTYETWKAWQSTEFLNELIISISSTFFVYYK